MEKACKKYGLPLVATPYKRGVKKYGTQAMKLKSKGVTHVLFSGFASSYAAFLKEAHKIGWKPVFFGDYGSVDPRAFMAGDLANGNYHIFCWGLRHEGGPGWANVEKSFKAVGAEKLLGVQLIPLEWNPLLLITEALKKTGKDLTREKFIEAIEQIGEYDTGGLGSIGYGPNMRKGTKYYRVLQADSKNKRFNPVTDWRDPDKLIKKK
jgi:ABC-type branched-subunit amino acid transport system substrate-binding protein